MKDIKIGFSSHGKWTTLREIRELEQERGNIFPNLDYPDDTLVIWVCLTRRKALRYLASADEWEHIDDETQPLTDIEKEMMAYEIIGIPIYPTDIVVHYDGDDGYLLLRKGGKNR